jgi:hypothetical protein
MPTVLDHSPLKPTKFYIILGRYGSDIYPVLNNIFGTRINALISKPHSTWPAKRPPESSPAGKNELSPDFIAPINIFIICVRKSELLGRADDYSFVTVLRRRLQKSSRPNYCLQIKFYAALGARSGIVSD